MTDEETVTRWRCARCQHTFDEPYEADQHDHAGREAEIREIEVLPKDTVPTSLSEWGFETASQRRDDRGGEQP